MKEFHQFAMKVVAYVYKKQLIMCVEATNNYVTDRVGWVNKR